MKNIRFSEEQIRRAPRLQMRLRSRRLAFIEVKGRTEVHPRTAAVVIDPAAEATLIQTAETWHPHPA